MASIENSHAQAFARLVVAESSNSDLHFGFVQSLFRLVAKPALPSELARAFSMHKPEPFLPQSFQHSAYAANSGSEHCLAGNERETGLDAQKPLTITLSVLGTDKLS